MEGDAKNLKEDTNNPQADNAPNSPGHSCGACLLFTTKLHLGMVRDPYLCCADGVGWSRYQVPSEGMGSRSPGALFVLAVPRHKLSLIHI